MDVLITARELAEALDSPTPPVVLDVRWQLTTAGGAAYDGHADYLAGHIPGAVFVDLDTELAGHAEPTEGRHPLPSIDSLQESARRWGIDDGDAVVVYDATGNLAAARAWWLLRWAGLGDVRLLDGGLAGWTRAGLGLVTVAAQPPRPAQSAPSRPAQSAPPRPAQSAPPRPAQSAPPRPAQSAPPRPAQSAPPRPAQSAPPRPAQSQPPRPARGNVTLSPGHLPTLDLPAVQRYAGQLVDARAAERYRGEVEPIDPKAGHIPGALNAPTTDNLAADGTFLPAAELRARFEEAGIDPERPVAAYCGSGVTAAHEIAALAIAGIDAALYAGSWSQWSNHDLPVER